MADGNQWAHHFVSEDEIRQISEAVKRVEQQTAGEIVPMIVRRSSAIGHLPLQIGLIFAVIFFAFEWPIEDLPVWVPLVTIFLCAFLGFALARYKFVQRWLTPDEDQNFQVQERALLEFYLAGLEKTAGRTGILIFLSTMEHETVVLADKGIAAKLPKDTWDHIVRDINKSIRDGQTAQGLIAAIENCGALLKQHFPALPGDKNELPNHLIIKE